MVVSPAALQSKWVGKELRHALKLREQRGVAQFGHASEPWTSWAFLAAIETDAGNAAAAAKAKGKAIAWYLAYRRDGGENHDGPGRLSLAVTQALRSGKSAEVANLLQPRAADPEARGCCPSSAPSRPSSPAATTRPRRSAGIGLHHGRRNPLAN